MVMHFPKKDICTVSDFSHTDMVAGNILKAQLIDEVSTTSRLNYVKELETELSCVAMQNPALSQTSADKHLAL